MLVDVIQCKLSIELLPFPPLVYPFAEHKPRPVVARFPTATLNTRIPSFNLFLSITLSIHFWCTNTPLHHFLCNLARKAYNDFPLYPWFYNSSLPSTSSPAHKRNPTFHFPKSQPPLCFTLRQRPDITVPIPKLFNLSKRQLILPIDNHWLAAVWINAFRQMDDVTHTQRHTHTHTHQP